MAYSNDDMDDMGSIVQRGILLLTRHVPTISFGLLGQKRMTRIVLPV